MKFPKLLLLSLLLLTGCNSGSSAFDSDFKSINSRLINETFANITYDTIDRYSFKIDNVPLIFRTYYVALEEKFTYAYVLNLEYLDEDVLDIRLMVVSYSKTNSTTAQIGFDGNKKNISSDIDVSTSTYKGLQVFITPFDPSQSQIAFYFETEGNGYYYNINEINEV